MVIPSILCICVLQAHPFMPTSYVFLDSFYNIPKIFSEKNAKVHLIKSRNQGFFWSLLGSFVLKASLISATPSIHVFCLPILYRTYLYRIFFFFSKEFGRKILPLMGSVKKYVFYQQCKLLI